VKGRVVVAAVRLFVCLSVCLRREGMVVPFAGDEQPNVSPTVAARR
jgi:hypothetical protein